ncbi:MAG: tetratricopeptide repeat protein [Brevinematales bacterium]|nr:tetratricopeptide repeat protein [Brevinematales bacterium]
MENQNNSLIKLLEFVNKFRMQLIISASLIAVILIGLIFYIYFKTSNEEKSAQLYDRAIFTIQNLMYVTNETERNEYYQQQINNLNLVVQNYPSTLGAIRARLFLGKIMYQTYTFSKNEEAMAQAISYYSGAFERSKIPFYKALALLGRAQCYEQKNDVAKAFEDYQEVYLKFKKEGFAPIALIGMARAKEMQNEVETSIGFYKKVLSDFPDSYWASFARGKVYFYEAK